MSGFVAEFGAVSGAGGNVSEVQIPVPGTIPAGDSLVVSVVTLSTGGPNMSISASDSKSNVWTHLATEVVGATFTSAHLAYCRVTTELTSSDTITITYPLSTTSRSAISVAQFNDVLTHDVGEGGNSDTSTTVLVTDPTAVTAEASELVFGAFGLVNAGRVFTATNGFTGLTKLVSDGGSGNRAIVPEYKYVGTTGAQTANGTLDVGGTWAGLVQTFTLAAAPSRSGMPKVWNGNAWVQQSAKVWNGSSWVEHRMKSWDGSSWIDSK